VPGLWYHQDEVLVIPVVGEEEVARPQPKYIFCINTGRSGSAYLAELLKHGANAVSVHEGYPRMNGEPMQAFNDGNKEPMQDLMQKKLDQMLATRGEKDTYCETNHYFIKGWGWLLPELVPQDEIGVIVLTREKESIVNSLLRIHAVPGASWWSNMWYCDPAAKENVLPAPHGTPQTHPVEYCRWYIDEIATRTVMYKREFPRIRYFHTTLEALNDYDSALRMFDFFGLSATETLRLVVGMPLNEKKEWPKLSRAELILPVKYPNPDLLPIGERKALVCRIVAYLVNERLPAELADLRGSPNSLVAPLIRELEDKFRYALFHTDTEWDVFWRFSRSARGCASGKAHEHEGVRAANKYGRRP